MAQEDQLSEFENVGSVDDVVQSVKDAQGCGDGGLRYEEVAVAPVGHRTGKGVECAASQIGLDDIHSQVVDALTLSIMAATRSSAENIKYGNPSGLDRAEASAEQAEVEHWGGLFDSEKVEASNSGLTLSQTLPLDLDLVGAYPYYNGHEEPMIVQTQSEVRAGGYDEEGRRDENVLRAQFDRGDRGLGLYDGESKCPSGLEVHRVHGGNEVKMTGNIARNFPERGEETTGLEHENKITMRASEVGVRNSLEFVGVIVPKAAGRPELPRRSSPRFRSEPAPLKHGKDEECSQSAYTSLTAPFPLSSELQNLSSTSSEENELACDEDEDNKFLIPIGSKPQSKSRQSKPSAGKSSSKRRRLAKQALSSMFSDDDKEPTGIPPQSRKEAKKKKDDRQPVKSTPRKKGRKRSVFTDEWIGNVSVDSSDLDSDDVDLEIVRPRKSSHIRKPKSKALTQNAVTELFDGEPSLALMKGIQKETRDCEEEVIDLTADGNSPSQGPAIPKDVDSDDGDVEDVLPRRSSRNRKSKETASIQNAVIEASNVEPSPPVKHCTWKRKKGCQSKTTNLTDIGDSPSKGPATANNVDSDGGDFEKSRPRRSPRNRKTKATTRTQNVVRKVSYGLPSSPLKKCTRKRKKGCKSKTINLPDIGESSSKKRAIAIEVDSDDGDFEELRPRRSPRNCKRKANARTQNAVVEMSDSEPSPALKKGSRKRKSGCHSQVIDLTEGGKVPSERRPGASKEAKNVGDSLSSAQGRSRKPIDLSHYVEALPRRKSNGKKYASYLYKRLTEEDAALIRIAFTSRYRPPPSNHKVQGYYEAEKGHVMTEKMKKDLWETKLKPWSDRWWKLYQEFGNVGREIKLAKEEMHKKPDLTERELRVAVEKFYAKNGPAKREGTGG